MCCCHADLARDHGNGWRYDGDVAVDDCGGGDDDYDDDVDADVGSKQYQEFLLFGSGCYILL